VRRDGQDERDSPREHLIGLIQSEHLNMIKTKSSSLNHIIDTTRSANDDMHTILKGTNIFTDSCATNAGMDLDVHEVSKRHDDFHDLLSKFTSGSKDKSLTVTN
jgi:hypothetical protein